MKKTNYHIITSLACLIWFHSGLTGQPLLVTGTVSGPMGKLEAATVSVKNHNTLTNKNGAFSLRLKAGTYILTVTHIGYEDLQKTVQLTDESNEFLELEMTPKEEMGEIIVLGNRSFEKRINLNSPVPIDILNADTLRATRQPQLTQMLNYAVPSLNASRQTIFEPVSLRGLDPDQVLIMVNGTRYHNMAYINDGRLRGVLGKGSVSNDLGSIPFSAIEKVEILRDGASAQYGSDAIAGVINIELKKTDHQTSVQLQLGQQYKGDGKNVVFRVHHGMDLNKRGFLNFSFDFNNRDSTFRGDAYQGTVYYNYDNNSSLEDSLKIKAIDDSLVKENHFNRQTVSHAGNSKATTIGGLINGAYSFGRKLELFWTGTLSSRRNTLISGYRFPKFRRNVNLILYPNGFQARVISDITDASGILGIREKISNQFAWSFTSSFGSNGADFNSKNTNNASQEFTLGTEAPTHFHTGSIHYHLWTNQLQVTKEFRKSKDNTRLLNIGGGIEFRREGYKSQMGETTSWQNYDPLNRKQGGSQNGLIISPDDEVNKYRNVFATYLDLESDLNPRLLLNAAGRYEYYNDFGGNISGKIAARWKITDLISIRGSVGTGFRAPALQQIYLNTTFKGLKIAGGTLVPTTNGIFRNGHGVAQALGIPNLKAEKSFNIGLGTVLQPYSSHWNLSIDAYWIRVKNRIVLSGIFDRQVNPDIDSLLYQYPDYDQVQFFANAINTNTKGIDLIFNGHWNLKKSYFGITLALNYNQTKMFGEVKVAGNIPQNDVNSNTLFNRTETTRLTDGVPKSKIILELLYERSRFSLVFRNTRFGETRIVFNEANPSLDESFTAKIITDLEFSYRLNSWARISVGANNLFNVYPDMIKDYRNTFDGALPYALEATPFGHNGGYYYLGLDFRW